MIITSSMHESWLSNNYLVADKPGGTAVLVDAGGPMKPILDKIAEQNLSLTHILCTHYHSDHTAHVSDYWERFGCRVGAHPLEGKLSGPFDLELEDGAELTAGELQIHTLHIPGHTPGHLAFLINEKHVFTGDTLFRGSIGGTGGCGEAGYGKIRFSIMEVLMKLPMATSVYPGHTDTTSIEYEWENNPFIRAWRETETITERPCTAFGRPAALIVEARDYDGGTKCWVRFEEDNRDAIVPGSQVRPAR
jgi:glyoxylase-like metal-dependent hydrolase (beta-lactamase superfamily II)